MSTTQSMLGRHLSKVTSQRNIHRQSSVKINDWSKTEFQIEDPDPYSISNGEQTRHARVPVHVHFRYKYS